MKRLFFLSILACASFLSLFASANYNANARLTADEIKAEIAKAAEYQSYLTNLFTDFSCSVLKDGITSDNLSSNPNYTSLSPSLQKMVAKIAGNNWSEDYSDKNLKSTYPNLYEDSWSHEYAVKYRVQDYEPYSESVASELVGVSRYTNMNNPTGIVGDKGDLIYVMVNDAVAPGATLYINEVWDPATMYNTATAGTQLKQGLNIIECKNNNSHFFIYYCVQTVKQSNGKYVADETHNLKNYKPITIHIEGGRLNGYFNYVGDARYKGDKQEDFEYTVQRATHPMYNLIGKYVILHFHLEDSPAVVGETKLYPCVKTVLFTNKGADPTREYDPVKILSAWDKMCLTERILMGLQSDAEVNDEYNLGLYEPNSQPYEIKVGDKSYKASPGFQYNEYFNNKLFGMSRQSEGLFMSAGDWRTSYNVYTIEAVLTQFTQGDIWGPAHEYGHMNQRLINMAGTTEESNNIFSNVVVYYQGKTTSRSDFISNQFKIFQEGKPFLEHGTWGTTRMFWQLWCYYHATGHNKKFYPRLFELLRNYPIQKTTRPGKHNELYDKLQFVKMCCLAAEEDLTDFFTAWGFFVPLELYSFADYNTYDTYLKEEDIQAVKEEIKSYGFDKNDAILFIDDRVNSQRDSYDNSFKKELAGDFGGFDAFNTDRAPSGSFGYSVDINTVTVTTDGDPGAGFIIKDKDGNLLGFSNSRTFMVNDDLAEKLRNGEAIMRAVGANNATQDVVNIISDGTIEEKTEILRRILDSSSNLLTYVDPTETKVGYLLKGKTAELEKLVNEVNNALKSMNLTSDAITGYIKSLTEEFNRLTADDDAFIHIKPGCLYMITNAIRNPNGALSHLNNVCSMSTKPAKPGDPSASNFQWNFVPVIDENSYYIQNWGSKAFLDKAVNGTVGLQFSEGYKYNLISFRDKNDNIGQFILAPFDNMNLALHIGGNGAVIGYTSEAGASKWYITKVKDASELDLSEFYKSQIQAILNKYNELESEIDPEGVKVGYLKPEVQNIINKNCALIKAVINDENYTSEQYKTFYEEQMDLFKGLREAENRIKIEPGAAYMIQNVEDGSRIMYTSDGNNLGTSETTNSKKFEGQWVFEDGKTPGTFVIRNLSNDKYISKVNQSNTKIPLMEEGAEFTLVDYPEEIGHYGIIADGTVSNALINSIISEGNIDYKMVIMTFLSGDAGKWNITQLRDKEYVALHDKLGELISHAQELFFNYDFWFLENSTDIYMLVQDLTSGESPYKNPETDKQTLQNLTDELDSNLSYADAILDEDEILTLNSIGNANDCVDNNSQENDIIRKAFNISDSIKFEGLIEIDDLEDPDNIIVEVQPVRTGQWVTSEATDKNSLMRDYQDAFTKTAPEAALFEQLQSLDCEFIDGFFTEVSGKLTQGTEDTEYNLVLHAPCSGLYKVTLRGKDGYAIFDDNKKIPSFIVEVYPNLTGIFNLDRGININGFSFADDEEHDKTIFLPKEAIAEMDLSKCTIYIPGLYFVDDLTAWLDSESNQHNIRSSKRMAASATSNPGASKYYCQIDLSCLSEMDEHDNPEKLNVSVAKNGATSNFTFFVGVGPNDNVSTKVEAIETNDAEETEYYNLQGIRIVHPAKGQILIEKKGNSINKILF